MPKQAYAGRPPRTEPDARRAELQRKAQAKYQKTEKGRATWRRYNSSPKGRAATKRYLSSPEGTLVRYLIERDPARRLQKSLYAQEKRIG